MTCSFDYEWAYGLIIYMCVYIYIYITIYNIFLYSQYIYYNVALNHMSDIFWYTYAGIYGGSMHMSEITESQGYMYVWLLDTGKNLPKFPTHQQSMRVLIALSANNM